MRRVRKTCKPIEATLVGLSLLCLSSTSHGYYACFQEAANRYSIPVALLYAIAKVESNFNPSAINQNQNGSSDHGLMQINNQWFSDLEKRFGLSRQKVANDPCTNIHVGAWILANNFSKNGRIWNSVGAYNAGFSAKNRQIRSLYVRKVKHYFDFYQAHLAQRNSQAMAR